MIAPDPAAVDVVAHVFSVLEVIAHKPHSESTLVRIAAGALHWYHI